MYYIIRPGIYEEYGLESEPDLPSIEISFRRGVIIEEKIDTPLIFGGDFTAQHPPKSFTGVSIPLWSAALLEAVMKAGASNIQTFESKIVNRDSGEEWPEYFAVNVIGILSCADMDKSLYTKIGNSPSGIPFVGFHKLVIDERRTKNLLLFRVAESPGEIVVHERINTALKQTAPEGGWGITATRLGASN